LDNKEIAFVIDSYATDLFIDHYDAGNQRRSEFQLLLTEHLRDLASAFRNLEKSDE